ncbi:MFS transporter [Kineosporia sp. J2-2]|uniref:MFS transporter n=1 Tax=Kineosporia corallincola TaxID=2835133 RepID=A0ABS5TJU9_9ACTN|nr:MFS transporter [Kineosporia corallincola]MBT0771113.1 MFS transporter [Kineosporia corallincola]
MGEGRLRLVLLAPYRELLRRPLVLPLFVTGVLCRMPNSAATVAITVFVVSGLDRSYAQAGLVAAVMTVGAAIGAPWRGRLLDRIGLRRTVAPSVLVEGAVWFAVPFLPYHLILVTAFVGGLLSIPVYMVVRQGLSVLAAPSQQRAAFSLDSISTELSYLVGPAAGAALASTWSPTGTVLLVGGTTVAAGLGLMVFDPPLRRPHPDPVPGPTPGPTPAGRSDLVSPRLVATLAATVVALAVIGATDVSVVALSRESGQMHLTWVVFVAWSLSSMTGAVVFGALDRPVPVFALVLALCLLTAPAGLVPGIWWLALAIVPAGLLCAPAMAAAGAEVSRLVPEHRRGEALGWYGSAMTVGLAAGTPLAGWAIDRAGPAAGFALTGTIGAAVAVVGLMLIRLATDRPSSDAEPALAGEFATEHGAPSGVSPTRRQHTQV